MNIISKLFILLALVMSQNSFAAKSSLFQNGAETFKVVDSKSKPAKFRVLDDSVTKQSLAVALNTAFKRSKSEVKPYVDLHIEKIILTPLKDNPQQVMMTVQISGRKVDVDQTIKKSELLSGKLIQLEAPNKKEEVGLFTVTSKGHLKFRYKAQKNLLLIENALARFQIENPMTSDEIEQIQFSGQGIRQ